jgi:hypothetical protein
MTEQNPSPPTAGAARSASEILSAAERLAEEITRGARDEAEAIRAGADAESEQARAAMRERIGRLGEMADAMQRQLNQMRSELEALRGSVGAASEPAGASEPAVASEPAGASEAAAAPDPATTPVSDPDEVAARLVALNMAMNDTPREEAARYLREHHSLADPERLLDEVYSGAGR